MGNKFMTRELAINRLFGIHEPIFRTPIFFLTNDKSDLEQLLAREADSLSSAALGRKELSLLISERERKS
jgi:hypothetical protein